MLTLSAIYTGATLVAIPYAIYNLGIVYGITALVSIGALTILAFHLLILAKDLTPVPSDSLYDIAYMLFGRFAIFFVAMIVFMRNIAAIALNYMVIGDTVSSLIE